MSISLREAGPPKVAGGAVAKSLGVTAQLGARRCIAEAIDRYVAGHAKYIHGAKFLQLTSKKQRPTLPAVYKLLRPG